MCTVVIRVPDDESGSVKILAVRDEDPDRPWRRLGPWWPDHPSVVGVMDELAGGAWLATDPDTRRLAVMLNRLGMPDVPDDAITSRGTLVMSSVTGQPLPDRVTTFGFNLVEVEGSSAAVTHWDGEALRRVPLAPGTHMMAHDDMDDPATARVAAWLPRFAGGSTDGDVWWGEWLDVLAESAGLDPTDDDAIIRDNHPHGFPTLSLLVCVAEVGAGGVSVADAVLDEPGRWNPGDVRGAASLIRSPSPRRLLAGTRAGCGRWRP